MILLYDIIYDIIYNYIQFISNPISISVAENFLQGIYFLKVYIL